MKNKNKEENKDSITARISIVFYRFCFKHLPKPFKKIVASICCIMYFLRLGLNSIIHQNCITGYLFQGKERNCGKNLKVLFLKCDENSISYLSNLIFSSEPLKEKIKKTYSWNIRRRFSKLSPDADAVFVKCDKSYVKFLQKHGFIIIPKMISMKLDVSDSLDDICSKFRRSIRKKIKKIENNFSYEISNDPDMFNLFYYKMYLPYAYYRYGKTADICDYNFTRSLFENGRLLFVKDGDNYILGLLIQYVDKNTALLALTGIMEGKYTYIDRNINEASTYYSILWAKKNNIKILNFGYCRAFLNDGILQHNKGWKTTINKFKSRDYTCRYNEVFGFKPYNYNEGIQSFLEKNPFICIYNPKIGGRIFLNHKVTCDEIRQIYKKYYIPGLAHLSIFSSQEFDSDVKEFVDSNYKGKIKLVKNF